MENLAQNTPIIGIGASAGGLEALSLLVSNIPDEMNACFVIVQHLASDQTSILDQLLQPKSPIPISQIEDGEPASPNHIYIVPPGKTLSLRKGRFKLDERPDAPHVFRPIDLFFKSLAAAKKHDAYCVVLSGTGTDGSDGLRAVKASGGFALVQESKTARFPGMPDSAVATGLVDFVLPVEEIAGRLHEVIRHKRAIHEIRTEKDLHQEISARLPDITQRLGKISGNDFSEYKPGTLVRRIERRMALLRLATVDAFVDLLTRDETQAQLLSQEFLIGVTQFFRDPETWEALREKVVVPLVQSDQPNLRVWVPGCSTGEETFTVAMIFMAEMERQGADKSLQVFGTDIDLAALMSARQGVFSQTAVDDLSDEQRDRFFAVEQDQFRAVAALREACVFAPHNLVQDPPFSRLDLLCCRNLMIYMSKDLQAKVMPRLHFALRDGGHLLLGPSESIDNSAKLFHTVDQGNRIFAKNSQTDTDYSALADFLSRTRTDRTAPQGGSQAETTIVSPEAIVSQGYMATCADPHALVNSRGDILFLSDGMVDFVHPSPGAPSRDIDTVLHSELRLPVRNALQKIIKSGETVRVENVVMQIRNAARLFDLQLSPVKHDAALFILRLAPVRTVDSDALERVIATRKEEDQNSLEIENFNLRKQLSNSLSDSDSSGQELKSSNEELLSMNEELQSSNEELETSREELQSINEELETVNAELQENNSLLIRANSDLKNLFESTDVAVLFLGRDFSIRNFTPASTRLFGIKKRDIGRPVSDLSWRIAYTQLDEDARLVKKTLREVEREVHVLASGQTFLLRMTPYRTTDNKIDGYVLSFMDITNRKKYEQTLEYNQIELAKQYAELENLYDTTPVGLTLVDKDYRWIRINETLAEINGFSVNEHIGKTQRELLPDVIADRVEPLYKQVFDTGKPVLGVDIAGTTAADPEKLRSWIADFYPVRTTGHVFAVGCCVRDVTEQVDMMSTLSEQAERQRLLTGELEHRVKNTLATVSAITKLLMRPEDTTQEYQKRLSQRLMSIARTHDLLTASDWEAVSMNDAIASELAPYTSSGVHRIRRIGPDVSLDPSETLSLSMALHELATNAAKYGALSVPEGRVDIITSRTDAETDMESIEFFWVEVDGPPIEKPPERTGFGSLVFDQVLTGDLDATVERTFSPTGLEFRVYLNRPAKT